MAIVLNGITAKERWDGYRKGRSDRGPTVTKEYDVAYADGDAFVDAVMGGVSVSGGIGGAITYARRHACPENPRLVALEASYEGAGEADYTGGGKPQFERAIATVTYGRLPYDQEGTDDAKNSFPNSKTPGQPYVYAQCEIDFAGEFVTLPGTGFKFSSDGKAIEESKHGKHVGTATLRFVRKKVPYLPTELILAKMNKVNDTPIFGAPRGQVLFQGGKTRREASSDGTAVQELELVFQWRETNWNNFIRPDTGAFAAVVTATGGNPVYAYAELNELLS